MRPSFPRRLDAALASTMTSSLPTTCLLQYDPGSISYRTTLPICQFLKASVPVISHIGYIRIQRSVAASTAFLQPFARLRELHNVRCKAASIRRIDKSLEQQLEAVCLDCLQYWSVKDKDAFIPCVFGQRPVQVSDFDHKCPSLPEHHRIPITLFPSNH